MLRICMVLHHCEEPFGGPELQALRLAKKFIADGHKVIVIAKGSGHYPKFEIIMDVPVYRLNHRGLASIEVYFSLFKLRNLFDIIHVHGTGRLATASIAFAKHFHKKVFVKVVANLGVINRKKVLSKVSPEKLHNFRFNKINALKTADGVIAITHDIVEDLLTLGFVKDKIAYIPNGVDMNLFYPTSLVEKQTLRKRLNLPIDKRVVVFTGKITKRKGIDVLLEAWRNSDIKDKAVLVVIGSGMGQKDSIEENAHNFVKEYNLNDSVSFLGAKDNVNEYLKASDIFVFPSRWEGLPNSLLEAMSTGLLCVASNIEGVDELIIPEKTGILTKVGDSNALGKALELACQHYSGELGINAALFIKQNFSIETTKQKLEELFSANK